MTQDDNLGDYLEKRLALRVKHHPVGKAAGLQLWTEVHVSISGLTKDISGRATVGRRTFAEAIKLDIDTPPESARCYVDTLVDVLLERTFLWWSHQPQPEPESDS